MKPSNIRVPVLRASSYTATKRESLFANDIPHSVCDQPFDLLAVLRGPGRQQDYIQFFALNHLAEIAIAFDRAEALLKSMTERVRSTLHSRCRSTHCHGRAVLLYRANL